MGDTVGGGQRQPRRLGDDYRPGTGAQRPARRRRGLDPRDAPQEGLDRTVRDISSGRGNRADGVVDIERAGAVHDLWGPLQWDDPDDFLPPRLLEELRERASLMQEVVDRSRNPGRREQLEDRGWLADLERPRSRSWTTGERFQPVQPALPWTPARPTPIEPVNDDAPRTDDSDDDEPEDSRFSLSHIRTSSLVLAAIVLILLGAVAHWVSNSGGNESQANTGRPVATALSRQLVAGEAMRISVQSAWQ